MPVKHYMWIDKYIYIGVTINIRKSRLDLALAKTVEDLALEILFVGACCPCKLQFPQCLVL